MSTVQGTLDPQMLLTDLPTDWDPERDGMMYDFYAICPKCNQAIDLVCWYGLDWQEIWWCGHCGYKGDNVADETPKYALRPLPPVPMANSLAGQYDYDAQDDTMEAGYDLLRARANNMYVGE